MSEGLVHPYQGDGEDGVNLFWGTVRSMSPGVTCSGIWKALLTAAPVLSDGTTPSRPWDIWLDQLAGGLLPRLRLWASPPSPPFPPFPHCLVWVGCDTPITRRLHFCFKTVPEYFFSPTKLRSAPLFLLKQNWCDYSILRQHLSLTTRCIVCLDLAMFACVVNCQSDHRLWTPHGVTKQHCQQFLKSVFLSADV